MSVGLCLHSQDFPTDWLTLWGQMDTKEEDILEVQTCEGGSFSGDETQESIVVRVNCV